MAGTQWGTVVQAVAAAWRALPGYRTPGTATSGTTVFIASQVLTESDPTGGSYCVVAYAGTPDNLTTSGSVEQTSGPLAANAGRPRDETGTIRCMVCAQSGDVDPVAVLNAAEVYVADLEGILRADPTLGITSLRRMVVQRAGTADEIAITSTSQGSICLVSVTLRYTARI